MIGAVYSLFALAVVFLLGERIGIPFIDGGETQILHDIYLYMMMNVVFYFLLALVNIVRFLIQGLGYSMFAILAGVCEMAARSVVGFLLVPKFGYPAVCLANGLAWIAADLFLIPAYYHVMKKLKVLFSGV